MGNLETLWTRVGNKGDKISVSHESFEKRFDNKLIKHMPINYVFQISSIIFIKPICKAIYIEKAPTCTAHGTRKKLKT